MNGPVFSVIIPVYNRPQEADELLASLTQQSFKNFEVILVDDGSTQRSEKVFEKYHGALAIKYFFKLNEGPGPTRNFGFRHATGQYLVSFDSDCIIPDRYFSIVDQFLQQTQLDVWGGPDKGDTGFTLTQRAMAYTMSSILTTGGIRGASAKGFQPRSFNMGIRREVFEKTGGFHFDRFAEDIEFSIRLKKSGFRVGLIADAFVYHKRRTNFNQFFKQVANFGKGRVLVGKVHPEAIKVTHWFPAFFMVGLLLLPILWVLARPLGWIDLIGIKVYFIAIFIGCLFSTHSLAVACLSVPAAFVQLAGYAYGFLAEWLKPASNS